MKNAHLRSLPQLVAEIAKRTGESRDVVYATIIRLRDPKFESLEGSGGAGFLVALAMRSGDRIEWTGDKRSRVLSAARVAYGDQDCWSRMEARILADDEIATLMTLARKLEEALA